MKLQKFNNLCQSILVQAKLSIPEKIKNQLMKYFNKSSWEQYINSQKFGDCRRIAEIVNVIYPPAKIFEVQQKYSPLAEKKLNQLNDFEEMEGNHFINQIDGILYDFGKGTNILKEIYLLCYSDQQNQKYDINLTQQEIQQFTQKYQRARLNALYKKGFKIK